MNRRGKFSKYIQQQAYSFSFTSFFFYWVLFSWFWFRFCWIKRKKDQNTQMNVEYAKASSLVLLFWFHFDLNSSQYRPIDARCWKRHQILTSDAVLLILLRCLSTRIQWDFVLYGSFSFFLNVGILFEHSVEFWNVASIIWMGIACNCVNWVFLVSLTVNIKWIKESGQFLNKFEVF